ncbi:MAG: YidB family protein [Acidobacteriota bacterium]
MAIADSTRQLFHREEMHMGLLDGVLGGMVGAGMMSVVSGIIEKHGGLQGVVSQFEKNGLGNTVKSWVGTGPNDAISPDEVHRALGPDLLKQLSEKSGLSVQDLAQKLAQVLPQAVDNLTPNGAIPKG